MLEKIRQYLGYVFGLIVAIGAAVIYTLVKKNDKLSAQVGQMQADKVIDQAVTKAKEARQESDYSEKGYYRVRDEYLRNHSGDGAGEQGLPGGNKEA